MDTRLLTGMLETMILEVISDQESYGYQITQDVLMRSKGRFELKEGSLYPALHRLERQRFLSSAWREYHGRRRKYYRLTAQGKKMLAARRTEWHTFAAGVNDVLGLEGG